MAEDVSAATSDLRSAYSIAEFVRAFGISRSSTYKLLAARKLRAVHVGRRVLITAADAQAWLNSLPSTN